MVVGKAGRADTPTDPAPLDMVETRHQPAPARALAEARSCDYKDAHRQTEDVLAAMIERGWIKQPIR